MIRRIVWTFPLLAAMGCAPLTPHYAFSAMGEVDPERDHAIVTRMEEAHKNKDAPPPDVKVLMDALPEGIDVSGISIKVEPGYEHKILGNFQIVPQFGMFYFTAWFFDYEAAWRKGVCYWQVPLEWVTLGFWSLVPTSYVCHPSRGRRTKIEVVADVKRAAAAAGADTVIMNFLFPHDDEASGASGILIKIDPRFKGDGLKTKPFDGKSPTTHRTLPAGPIEGARRGRKERLAVDVVSAQGADPASLSR